MFFFSKHLGKFLSLPQYLPVSVEASNCHFKRNNDLVRAVQSLLKLNKSFPVAFVVAVGLSLNKLLRTASLRTAKKHVNVKGLSFYLKMYLTGLK